MLLKCDTIREALENYETSENVKAQQPEHRCDTKPKTNFRPNKCTLLRFEVF